LSGLGGVSDDRFGHIGMFDQALFEYLKVLHGVSSTILPIGIVVRRFAQHRMTIKRIERIAARAPHKFFRSFKMD